ncbi:MAG TPA: carbohydrate-binding family 9-like protein [Tepidisphaeraceae bacterium]|nr:carbohydrate-binding family 9-like protein [Tepidisphaeraceae bacterium]
MTCLNVDSRKRDGGTRYLPRLARGASALMIGAALTATIGTMFAQTRPAEHAALAVPRGGVAPRMDASADDPAWRDAARIERLALAEGPQAESVEPVATEVRLLWRPEALYVRFINKDDEPYAPHEGRDAMHHDGDVVEVFVDPVGDGRQWYEIQVSPANGVLDKLYVMTAPPTTDDDGRLTGPSRRELWQLLEHDIPGLRTAAGPTDGGWIADVAIPAGALVKRTGGKALAPIAMRLNLVRYDRPTAATDGTRGAVFMNWVPARWGQPHVSPARMGRIELRETSAAR